MSRSEIYMLFCLHFQKLDTHLWQPGLTGQDLLNLMFCSSGQVLGTVFMSNGTKYKSSVERSHKLGEVFAACKFRNIVPISYNQAKNVRSMLNLNYKLSY